MFRKVLEIREHSGAVYSCDFDGTFLYSASADQFITRWDIKTGVQDPFAIRFENAVYSITVREDHLYAGLSNGDLHIFDLKTRQELKHYIRNGKAIFSIRAHTNNGSTLSGDAEGNLSVWDNRSLKLLLELPIGCGKIRDIQFSASGERVLLACQDGTFRIFDTQNFNELNTIAAHEGGCTSAIFHPDDETQVISGGKDAHLRLWDLRDGRPLKNIPAHNFAIYRLIICEGHLISASRDKSVKVWSKGLDFIQKLDAKEGGHVHSVNDLVVIAPDSFASCGDDRRIIIWKS